MKRSLARKLQNKEAFNELNVSWVICSHQKKKNGAEDGVIVLIYTIRHPIRWVRNSSYTVVTSSYITTQACGLCVMVTKTLIAMLWRRRAVRDRRGGLRSRGILSASRSHLIGHLSHVYSIEWFVFTA